MGFDTATDTIKSLVGRTRGKWRPVAGPLTVLRNVGDQYKKIVEHGRRTPQVNGRVTFLELAKANEYLRAIDIGKDVVASEFCPYSADLIDGCISIERLTDGLTRTVKSNCQFDTVDWIHTVAYANENLS